MSNPITLPLWIIVVLAILAVWAVISQLLLPSVRWFIGRQVNRLTERLNRNLHLKIPAIAITHRRVLIDRLVYDPKVLSEATEYADREGIPREVALREVERYAGEIVPAFNAYMYFRLGSAIGKTLVSSLYRVRLGHANDAALASLDSNASVVFVMNHRSNMDYILVAYLAREKVALSYAVGEWAKVWPIQQLIRSLGAYFVRRGSGNVLYRRVLERYVQIAVEAGAVQAIFPEGGLSRDGLLRQPKIGLLDYMLRTFDINSGRDIVFVPVALNYDRVLEDRTLLASTSSDGERRSGLAAVRTAFGFLASQLWLRLRGKWYRHGYACANFGAPISLRSYLAEHRWNPGALDREARTAHTMELAEDLMAAVGRLVPVLPVSLMASIFCDEPQRIWTETELRECALQRQREFEALGAQVYIPRNDPDYSVMVGLRMLTLRHLVLERGGRYKMNPDEVAVVRYYANAIAHLSRPPLRLSMQSAQ